MRHCPYVVTFSLLFRFYTPLLTHNCIVKTEWNNKEIKQTDNATCACSCVSLTRASCCILRVPRRFEATRAAHTPENPLPNRIPFLPEIVRRIGNKVLVLGKKKSRFRYRIFSRAELGRSARHEGATSQGRGRWSRDGGVAHWATGVRRPPPSPHAAPVGFIINSHQQIRQSPLGRYTRGGTTHTYTYTNINTYINTNMHRHSYTLTHWYILYIHSFNIYFT